MLLSKGNRRATCWLRDEVFSEGEGSDTKIVCGPTQWRAGLLAGGRSDGRCVQKDCRKRGMGCCQGGVARVVGCSGSGLMMHDAARYGGVLCRSVRRAAVVLGCACHVGHLHSVHRRSRCLRCRQSHACCRADKKNQQAERCDECGVDALHDRQNQCTPFVSYT